MLDLAYELTDTWVHNNQYQIIHIINSITF